MAKSKILKGEWANMKPADLNRLLRPLGVRLLVKHSKNWGKEVAVTAEWTLVPNVEVVFDDAVARGDVESVADLIDRNR